MLELNNIQKYYPFGHTALEHVSLTIRPGEIVGLFGENGAGKTTLLKCILGLLNHSGTVKLDGEPITTKNIARLSFGTCEHSFFPTMNALGHREFYAEHFEKFNGRRFDALMDFFKLPPARPIGKLSSGQQNQFEVILAVSQGADYILLDEPFVNNDVFNRDDFYKVLLGILEPHETILLSTHLLEEVEPFISRAVLLHEGRIVGDVALDELEEQGRSLMQYVRECCGHSSDRLIKVLKDATGEE